jgi:hypothetical protein
MKAMGAEGSNYFYGYGSFLYNLLKIVTVERAQCKKNPLPV